jgi:hypothetical protein
MNEVAERELRMLRYMALELARAVERHHVNDKHPIPPNGSHEFCARDACIIARELRLYLAQRP